MSMADPPPTVVTTSLVHKELHVVPVRLVFYRTPRSHKHAPPSTSDIGVTPTSLIHPLNSPLCPIVCQATVLSDVEYQSGNNNDTGFRPSLSHDTDEPGPSMHPSGASLFEELETGRGSSWQYELQQLKFANQRLQEELQALESVRANSGAVHGSSSGTVGTGHMATVPLGLGQPCSPSSSTTTLPIPHQPQTRLHYTPLMHSNLSPSLSSLCPPNSLHEYDPPPSEWSSLAGANGQGRNPLKRSWRSEDGLTT